MNKTYIEEGDFVQVYFSTAPTIRGWVQFIPMNLGENWVIQTGEGGLSYVQNYDMIKLILRRKDQ